MRKVYRYRCDDTGDLLTEAQARRRAIKRNVNLARDASRWSQAALAYAHLERVWDAPRPEINEDTQRATAIVERRSDGVWVRRWRIDMIEDPLPRWKVRMKRRAKAICDEKRNAGIVFGGVPISTTAEGIALLGTATYYNRKTRDVVADGKTYRMTPIQLREAKVAADDYVQGCMSRLAALYQQIDAAQDIEQIDLSVGWPDA